MHKADDNVFIHYCVLLTSVKQICKLPHFENSRVNRKFLCSKMLCVRVTHPLILIDAIITVLLCLPLVTVNSAQFDIFVFMTTV